MDFSKAQQLLSKMNEGGVLLTSGKKPNTMVIGWGSIGVYWGKPVFIAPVRVSRYTREQIDATQEFCVTVPGEALKSAMKVFGAKSGRNTDKYLEAKVKPVKCRKISASTLEGGVLTIECKVVAEMEMEPDCVQQDVDAKWYANGDYHVMYYGEIVDIYE